MPRNLFNWTFKDVANFLKNNNFELKHTEGSHFYYTKKTSKQNFLVCVPFHGSKTIKIRTLGGIIKQSGITKKSWLKK